MVSKDGFDALPGDGCREADCFWTAIGTHGGMEFSTASCDQQHSCIVASDACVSLSCAEDQVRKYLELCLASSHAAC